MLGKTLARALPFLGILLTSETASAQSLCERARAAVPALPICLQTPHGVVLARDADKSEAAAAADNAAQGELRFRHYFGREVPSYAVVYGFEETHAVDALGKAGFKAVLPWLNQAEKIASAEASAREAVEVQTKSLGLSPQQIKDAADQAANMARARLIKVAQQNDISAVPHELGHNWFVQTYWPGSHMDQGRHYGGPAPDWMDETAAILMEGDTFAANRRESFRKAYTSDEPNQLYALARLFHMQHPMLELQNQIKSQMAVGGQRAVVRVIGKDDAKRQGIDLAGNFYSENRVLADFLIERTRDPMIFDSIAQSLARGETFEQWLASTGKKKGLANSIEGLDVQWREWLTSKFGKPATQ